MNYFRTETTYRKKIIAFSIEFLVMALLALFGLSVTVAFCIFLECMILICGAFIIFMTTRASLVIELRNNTLTLKDNRQTYYFDELTQASFRLKQSEGQKKLDLGDARLVGYPTIAMDDIKNYSEFVKYIETNLK